MDLYERVYALLGGECQCGGEILECTEECCPTPAMENLSPLEVMSSPAGASSLAEGVCGKSVMHDLKQALARAKGENDERLA